MEKGDKMPQKEALYYQSMDRDKVKCLLCPHHCVIRSGHSGICRVRKNENGKLYTKIYGEVGALALDPIEKKPLYHFYPGRQILSAGTWGCNLSCSFCQNYSLAHERAECQEIMPQQMVELAMKTREQDSVGIAFTYNEPSIWFEYVIDTVRLAKEKGLKIVLVTNGFIDQEPVAELLPFIDAANVDLKAFTEDFYRRNCKGRLQEVQENIAFMAGKIHLELTHLLITGENDDPEETEEMAEWIGNLDSTIPLHLSRYHPAYKMQQPATEWSTMLKARDICQKYLPFVYLGNLAGMDNNTLCQECGKILIHRNAYRTEIIGIETGCCLYCGAQIDHIVGG